VILFSAVPPPERPPREDDDDGPEGERSGPEGPYDEDVGDVEEAGVPYADVGDPEGEGVRGEEARGAALSLADVGQIALADLNRFVELFEDALKVGVVGLHQGC
jgi:hypothetical protein